MRLDLTEHWQFTQHSSHFEIENSVMKSISILSKGRSQLVTLLGINPALFKFLGLWGALTPQDGQFCLYTK